MLVFSARVTPFILSFVTDADEAIPGGGATTADELATAATPGRTGTTGFSLGFRQVPCV